MIAWRERLPAPATLTRPDARCASCVGDGGSERAPAARLLVYAHGRITIRDRHGLESAACECYRIIRRELDRLLDGHEAPDPLAGVRVSELGKSTLSDASADEPARDDIKLR